jgi:methylphosphotriester-DNA--protein-cysteine methyltransferase
MISHLELKDHKLTKVLKQKHIRFGGNIKLKIYGTLLCKSGKRIKRENRVFFSTEQEAINDGYRPCGHCMRTDYLKWKNGFIQ